MITFKSLQEKEQHSQAKLIPLIIWNDANLFNRSLSPMEIEVMKRPINDSINYIQENNTPTAINDRKKLFLAFAFAHPEATISQIAKISSKYELKKNTLFSLFIMIGNIRYIQAYLQLSLNVQDIREQNQQKDFLTKVFAISNSAFYRIAARYGHLNLLKFIESIQNNTAATMSTFDNYAAYSTAFKNEHQHIVEHLAEQIPSELRADVDIQILQGDQTDEEFAQMLDNIFTESLEKKQKEEEELAFIETEEFRTLLKEVIIEDKKQGRLQPTDFDYLSPPPSPKNTSSSVGFFASSSKRDLDEPILDAQANKKRKMM